MVSTPDTLHMVAPGVIRRGGPVGVHPLGSDRRLELFGPPWFDTLGLILGPPLRFIAPGVGLSAPFLDLCRATFVRILAFIFIV